MKNHSFLLLLCLALMLASSGCSKTSSNKEKPATSENKEQPASLKIAFGSCGNPYRPLPIFDRVVEHQPDLFIFLGDNIYGDTDDMKILKAKYQNLADLPSFQNLKEHTEILAIWDDHDYGRNDAGNEYPHKAASKQVFLEFFKEPKESSRYQHQGIYHSVTRQVGEKIVQIILLDGRSFRDSIPRNPQRGKDKHSFYPLDYLPTKDTSKSMLGEEQWAWLEQELLKPADCRIIASGTQFGIEYNGYEAWANYPHEQERFVQLIKKTQANNLLFISGDVHYAEISKFERPDCYPLYDITSSGLNHAHKFAAPNKNRIEGPVMDNHFGLMTLNLTAPEPHVIAEIWDIRDNQRVEHTIPFKEIRFAGK